MENYLWFINKAYGIKIISFVLMPNHFHLIIESPKSNLSEAMNYFMRETSRQMGKKSGRINQIYRGRFHRTAILNTRYFYQVYKYVYLNPVTANISKNVEDYPFSTLSGKIGITKLLIPVEEDKILFSDPFCSNALQWLNKCPKKQNFKSVKSALKKCVFKLPKNRSSRKENELETKRF